MILRPFFRYYGAKWRAVHQGLYPAPTHKRIYEPFAGAAGYAMHYPDHEVHLIDRDPTICCIWRWLISTTPEEVLSIPLTDDVSTLPEWVPLGARDLIGFSMNAATSSPRKTLSASARKLREQGRNFYGWTAEMRQRVADQVPHIKHWHVHEGDYTNAHNDVSTWFVDYPYADGGKHYKFSHVNTARLAEWCLERRGQLIVCERAGATWLSFSDIGDIKSGPRTRSTREAVFVREVS